MDKLRKEISKLFFYFFKQIGEKADEGASRYLFCRLR